MTELECEIEYLDEDADIVQQLVQSQPAVSLKPTFPELVERPQPPLLVERPKKRKRVQKKIEESDDDYDPNEDLEPPSPPSPGPKLKKKKPVIPKKPQKPEKDLLPEYRPVKQMNYKKVMRENRVLSGDEQYALHKKLNIKIPDFDDPLCLPVKALDTEPGDKKRLDTWNNVCLEHFKQCDNTLRPERGETKSSSRTVILRNIFNKRADRKETTIWSKTCVVNEDGDKKSEIFQCYLPNYQEKKTLSITNFNLRNLKSASVTVDEVVLRKEEYKDDDVLVVYKPQSGLSSVFKMIDKRKPQEDEEQKPQETENNMSKEEKSSAIDSEDMRYLREMTCNRMCVCCFQESWRGLKKIKGPIACPICGRSFVTVYSLLTHIKAHSSVDVQRYKRVISLTLSEIVGYHYKCRMCREKCTSIKDIRKHVRTHKGTELFMCEICNHLTR